MNTNDVLPASRSSANLAESEELSLKKEIAGLRAELRHFREADAERRLDPILISLIRLSDAVARRVAAFRRLPPESLRADELLEQFDGVELDLSLLLEKYEISAYREEKEIFEPRLQQVAGMELTEDPGKIGRIAARIRPGFLHRERIIMKERVAVYSDLGPPAS